MPFVESFLDNLRNGYKSWKSQWILFEDDERIEPMFEFSLEEETVHLLRQIIIAIL